MGRTSIPEYRITTPRHSYYPREAFTKRARIKDEIERMVTVAKMRGLPTDTLSIYQGSPESIAEHEPRHGYDLPWGPNGVTYVARDKGRKLEGMEWGKQIFSYKESSAPDLAKPNVDVAAVLV